MPYAIKKYAYIWLKGDSYNLKYFDWNVIKLITYIHILVLRAISRVFLNICNIVYKISH